MTDLATRSTHGSLIEPATLKIERILPGPIERVWAYLTESDLRRRWLAAGEMPMKAGSTFELHWRNDDLTKPSGQRPPGFGEEHRKECRIIEADPPRKLAFVFAEHGNVSIELAERGDRVLLTLIHSRIPDRSTTLGVSAGWHAHLDILVARVSGTEPEPFWDHWRRLKTEYEQRLPG
jgi:uncharacterized protein YndB with AHSA1/START domain